MTFEEWQNNFELNKYVSGIPRYLRLFNSKEFEPIRFNLRDRMKSENKYFSGKEIFDAFMTSFNSDGEVICNSDYEETLLNPLFLGDIFLRSLFEEKRRD